ncbi:MAG TPA: hypothetical protein VH351_13250 [Bryobacteraceae bacterium]|nr:hypothetical protein [Bryobacteraceae bacterium]
MNAAKGGGKLTGGLYSCDVIRVNTEEEVVVPVPDGGNVVPDHVADNGRFFPTGDEDGDAALGVKAGRGTVASPADDPIPKANEGGDKVLCAAEKEKSGESAQEEGPNRYEAV